MKFLTIAALAITATAATASPELVVNGDFETGNFTGWTKSGNNDLSDVISNTVTTNHTYLWRSGATGSEAFISQDITTAAGATYTLSFDIFNTSTSNSAFDVWFDGVDVYSFANVVHNWDHVELSLTATTGLTTLMFGARNDPSFTRLDNVSLMLTSDPAPTDVPEPAMLGLFGLGALGLGLARRRS